MLGNSSRRANSDDQLAAFIENFFETSSTREIDLLSDFLDAGGKIHHKNVNSYFFSLDIHYGYSWWSKKRIDEITIDDGITDPSQGAEYIRYALDSLNNGVFYNSSVLSHFIAKRHNDKVFGDLGRTIEKLPANVPAFLSFRKITGDEIVKLTNTIVEVTSYTPVGSYISVFEAVSGKKADVYGTPIELSTGQRVFQFTVAGAGTLFGFVFSAGGKKLFQIIGKTVKKLSPPAAKAFASAAVKKLIGTSSSIASKFFQKLDKIRAKLGFGSRYAPRGLLRSSLSPAEEKLFRGGLDAAQESFDDVLVKLFKDADAGDFQGIWLDRLKRTQFDDAELAIFFQREGHITGRVVGEEVQHAIDYAQGGTRAHVIREASKHVDEAEVVEWWHRRVFTRLLQNINEGKHGLGGMREYMDDIYRAYQNVGGKLEIEELLKRRFDGLF